MDGGQEVQLDRLAPGIRRLVLERSRGGTAGIAEQHVEAAELLCDVLHQFLSLGRNRHVRGEGRRLGIAAVDRDLRAFRGEQVRDRTADAAGATADERYSSRETEIQARSILTAQTFSSAILA